MYVFIHGSGGGWWSRPVARLRGASERQRLGDAPTLGYNFPSTFGEEMPPPPRKNSLFPLGGTCLVFPASRLLLLCHACVAPFGARSSRWICMQMQIVHQQ